jgi:two-component system, NarL family, response regulator LiaR
LPNDAVEGNPTAALPSLERPPIAVVVVADRETTRAALIHVLEEDPELKVIGEASDLTTAKALLGASNPKVVLVNLALNGRDAPGLSFIRYAKATRPDVGILSLKRQVEEHLLRSTLDAGADACCLATTSESRLRSAIKAVAEGATWLDPEISRILLHRRAEPGGSGRRASDIARENDPHLSPREVEVLRLLTEGYTNEEIATNLCCSEATIKTHLIHLFRKLDVHDRVSAAVRGLRRGIV